MSRVRPRSFQHVVASSNSSAAVRQQAGSLHPLVPRPDELVLGWLPASLLLMLQKFNALGVFSERLLLFLEVNTGWVHLSPACLTCACLQLNLPSAVVAPPCTSLQALPRLHGTTGIIPSRLEA